MAQLEDLQDFITQRLHVIATEIFGAVEKTVTAYEAQACRLREEKRRLCSELDLLIKARQEEMDLPFSSISEEAVPPSSEPWCQPELGIQDEEDQKFSLLGVKEEPVVPTEEHDHSSSVHISEANPPQPPAGEDLPLAFTSCADFLQWACCSDSCPYCMKGCQATEAHLMRRHYSFAVHFNQDGIDTFVVPCMCKDLVQGRSHWHCPYCRKILNRKVNFEGHVSKKHGYATLQQSQDSEMDLPFSSISEEAVPPSSEPWCQPELGIQDEEDQKFSLLGVKEEPGLPTGEQSKAGQDWSHNVMYVESSGQEFHEIEGMESNLKVGSKHAPSSASNAPKSKRRRLRAPAGQTNAGTFCCQVCGKTFYEINALQSHVSTHVGKDSLCGICGEHIKDTKTLVQHLRSHTLWKKCKPLSNVDGLKAHAMLHVDC
ncbi:zinc finger protein 572-like isoform X2 [Nerophis ophidion]|uniref:zinc finger protein 572-like isoform X2 n=1 Tax=Nerophis ophidion TaxID=159077 RepID=UPI002AE06F96|nr:zinc finger protein 572-like isoform X2 [Nerophis ophidion]